MSKEKTYAIRAPGELTPRIIQMLKNKTSSLTARIEWNGMSEVEFVALDSISDSKDLLLKIRLACPSVEIEDRSSGSAVEVPKVPVGTWIEGRIISCPNKNCVTVQPKEPTKPKYRIVSWKPVTLQCFYCGRYINEDAIVEQLS